MLFRRTESTEDMKRACFPRPGTSTVRVYKYEKWHFSTFFSSKNDFSTVCKYEKHCMFQSSLFFVKLRDFITDYLNIPAFTFTSEFLWFELKFVKIFWPARRRRRRSAVCRTCCSSSRSDRKRTTRTIFPASCAVSE